MLRTRPSRTALWFVTSCSMACSPQLGAGGQLDADLPDLPDSGSGQTTDARQAEGGPDSSATPLLDASTSLDDAAKANLDAGLGASVEPDAAIADAASPDDLDAAVADGSTQQAHFILLGMRPEGEVSTHAADVTAAGDTIVGTIGTGTNAEAVRFLADGSLVRLGGSPSSASGVSPSGNYVVGSRSGVSPDGGPIPGRWNAGGEFELLPGPVVAGQEFVSFKAASAVADDGRVVGQCQQYGAYAALACRFDGPGQIVAQGGQAFAVRAGGRWSGTRITPRDPRAPAFLDELTLPYPDGVQCAGNRTCSVQARDFTADGLVVGTSAVPQTSVPEPQPPNVASAFVYTTAEGSVRLPDRPGGANESGAFAFSDDGRVIAGYGTDEFGQQAVLWQVRQPVIVASLVDPAELPPGFRLEEAVALSADEQVIVGARC